MVCNNQGQRQRHLDLKAAGTQGLSICSPGYSSVEQNEGNRRGNKNRKILGREKHSKKAHVNFRKKQPEHYTESKVGMTKERCCAGGYEPTHHTLPGLPGCQPGDPRGHCSVGVLRTDGSLFERPSYFSLYGSKYAGQF